MRLKKQIVLIVSGLSMLFFFGMTNLLANTVLFNLGEASKSIDPQLVTGITGSQVDVACMEGLTNVKKDGVTVPAGAKSWTISKDGLVYTFHLRKNAKWSNGEAVTANDYFFGMKRALEPATAAQYAYFLYNVKNAEAYNSSKIKDFSKVGIKVINKYTLQITLAAPCTYFLQLVSAPTTFPCNEKFYNKVKSNYALTPKDMLYNGPWEMTQWITGAGGKFVFKKNPYYWDKKNIKIDNLIFKLINNPNTIAIMFKTNQLDLAKITADQLSQFKYNPEYKKEIKYIPGGGLWYLEFNMHNKYLKNQKIRRAITLAINRSQLCKFVLKNHSKPLYAFIPPGTKGPDGKTFREAYGNYNIKENIKEAKKLLAEGKKELGITGPIHIKLLLNQGGVNQKVCVFIQQQLMKNLGLNVTLDVQTFQGRLVKMQQHDFDMIYAGWIPDYNDPMTYFDMFITGGGNNDPQYSDKEYDSLISKAKISPNDNQRMKYMHQAEQIFMKANPIAPLFVPYAIWLEKSWLKNVEFTQITPAVNFRWAYVKK
ncbi:MAG TPA: peptide ABC transporter substrate-binding protein [Victivallales bacterium]|nr:peptide ABC transporter substrate-binding protein [Victivallales bacterium]